MTSKWVPFENQPGSDSDGPENSTQFIVLSYNILAQDHLLNNSYLYKTQLPEQLEWETRQELIFSRILDARPDIVMLQEVQKSQLDVIRKKLASELNHGSFYSQRPNGKPDGCLVSYNNERFLPVKYGCQVCEFNRGIDFSKNCPLNGISDNTGLVCVFQDLDYPEKYVIVANTHLVYSPNRGHIKLWQLTRLLLEVKCFRILLRKEFGVQDDNITIILGGDLNSALESPLCKYLEGVDIDMENVSTRQFSGQKQDNNNTKSILSCIEDGVTIPFQSQENPRIIQSNLKLDRVYEVDKNSDKYTTISRKFYDHLFTQNLVTKEYIEIPLSKDSGNYHLPNEMHGSDHVPVGAKVLYK